MVRSYWVQIDDDPLLANSLNEHQILEDVRYAINEDDGENNDEDNNATI